jgi:hypothetical protein
MSACLLPHPVTLTLEYCGLGVQAVGGDCEATGRIVELLRSRPRPPQEDPAPSSATPSGSASSSRKACGRGSSGRG